MATLKATEQLFTEVMASLVLNDSKSLHAMNAAMTQGCEVQLLITVKPKGTVQVGFCDDYGISHWIYSMPLQ